MTNVEVNNDRPSKNSPKASGQTSSVAAPQRGQKEIVNLFIDQMQNLYEAEYGDFKRKVGLYLERLEQSLSLHAPSKDLQNKFRDIRQQIIFNSIPDIETARIAILRWADSLI